MSGAFDVHDWSHSGPSCRARHAHARQPRPLADVADGERRDGGPERVIRRKDAVIPVPVLARRRHEVGEPVEKLKRREVNDAVGPWSRGLVPATKAVLRDSE